MINVKLENYYKWEKYILFSGAKQNIHIVTYTIWRKIYTLLLNNIIKNCAWSFAEEGEDGNMFLIWYILVISELLFYLLAVV